MNGIREPTGREIERDAELIMRLRELARRQRKQFRFEREARAVIRDGLVKLLCAQSSSSIKILHMELIKKNKKRTGFERDVAQKDERVCHLEPHLVVTLHMLLVYRAREIEYLPRGIEIVFGLCLVLTITIGIGITSLFHAFRIGLGRLGKKIYRGIIPLLLFRVARERQDLVSIRGGLCKRP